MTVTESGRGVARRMGLSVVVALFGLLLVAAPSQAHSQEVASDPADESTVSIVPAAVTMTFNENVLALGTRVEVTGPDGDVTDGTPEVTDNVVYQAVSADAPAGTYTVQWRVTSGDGHPISGGFIFTAKEGALAQMSSTPIESPATAAATATPSATPTTPSDSSNEDSGGLSGLAITGLAAVVLIILIGLGMALARIARSRRS